jgi:ABC-type transport system involved in multi-copper enzyme maturation permease subunit
MLKTIIYHEFLSNIITFRFLLGLLVCVGLVSANTVVLIRDYEERLQEYYPKVQEYIDGIHNIRAYSELELTRRPLAWKKPNLLKILNEGIEGQVGDTLEVTHSWAPVFTWDEESHGNPYLIIFPKNDLTIVFQIVISLLAFLFAYDAVAGERENGTLALMLSNSIRRSTLLLGKYIGGMLSLVVPLAISLLVSLQIIFFSPYVQLTGSDWARIGVFCLVSLLYVSAFFTLGMLFSSTTRRAATALIFSMFFWVVFVVVWPHASAFVVSQLAPLKSDEHLTFDGAWSALSKGDDAWIRKKGAAQHPVLILESQFMREKIKFAAQHGLPMSFPWTKPQVLTPGNDSNYLLSGTHIGRYNGPPEKQSVFHEYGRFRGELLIRLGDELSKMRREYLIQYPVRQVKLTDMIAKISPAGAYASATAILADTDIGSHLRFLDQAVQYRIELIQYLRDKNAFGSTKWYDPEAFNKSDAEGIPIWHEGSESFTSSLRRATPDFLILLALNVVFFLLTFTAFLRYDAR